MFYCLAMDAHHVQKVTDNAQLLGITQVLNWRQRLLHTETCNDRCADVCDAAASVADYAFRLATCHSSFHHLIQPHPYCCIECTNTVQHITCRCAGGLDKYLHSVCLKSVCSFALNDCLAPVSLPS